MSNRTNSSIGRTLSKWIAGGLLCVHFVSIGTVFGQAIIEPDSDLHSETDIFPFAGSFLTDFAEPAFSSGFSEEDQWMEVTGYSDGADILSPAGLSGYADARTVPYSEELFDIADDGVFSPEGFMVNADDVFNLFGDDDELIVELIGPEILALQKENSEFDEYRESIILNWGGQRAYTEQRLKNAREDLEGEGRRFDFIGEQIERIEQEMIPLQVEIVDLKGQVSVLNNQLNLTQRKIKVVETQIASKQLKLADLMRDLKLKEAELNIQRQTVLNYILMVYHQEEKFLDYFGGNTSSTLKLILADNSVSENLLGKEYMRILEESGREVFYDLQDRKQAIDDQRDAIQQEKEALSILDQALMQERRILEEGKTAKKDLLADTLGREELYQRMLEESLNQQLESALAIENLRDNIFVIEGKLKELDSSIERFDAMMPEVRETEALGLDPMSGYLDETIELSLDLQADGTLPEVIPEFQPFVWPVPPVAVTAYFEDPTYPARWGVHKAVDLRAKQYTEIRAPANGYVFQTKDNGTGYSYIILAHKNKFITVYGHVSEIKVKPGTVVKQGEVIGLSGGTPGTRGAGWQTTGPHLHFEVWHEGTQVDPLDYLPVMELPEKYIPERFVSK